MNSSPGTPFLKVFLRRYLTAAPREAAYTMGNQAVGAGVLVLNVRLVWVFCLPDCIELYATETNLNPSSSCLFLLSARVTSVCHYPQIFKSFLRQGVTHWTAQVGLKSRVPLLPPNASTAGCTITPGLHLSINCISQLPNIQNPEKASRVPLHQGQQPHSCQPLNCVFLEAQCRRATDHWLGFQAFWCHPPSCVSLLAEVSHDVGL